MSVTTSLPVSGRYRLRPSLLLTELGSKSKTPQTLPFFTESLPTSSFVFSDHSGPTLTTTKAAKAQAERERQHYRTRPDEWIEANFYEPDSVGLIRLLPYQRACLRFAAQQNEDGSNRWRTVVWSQRKKSGKALALDTPLATPDGWTTMGAVRPGDTVFDERGEPCRVTFATEVMHGHDCFRVVFSDGTSIVADADHLWQVERLDRQYTKHVMTTVEMRGSVSRRADRARNYRIPVASALVLPERPLPVAPYVLGAWLGDGDTAGGRITCVEQEILDRITETDPIVAHKVKARTPTYQIGGLLHGAAHERRAESLTYRLRMLGVLGNKHIPQQYLRASHDQRLALLQGLMDTDGTIGKARGVSGCESEFSVSVERLALDCRELLTTLGIKSTLIADPARLYGKDCGTRYRVKFHATSALPVFSLSRKLARQRPATHRTLRSTNRHITAIEPVASVPVRCIQVDSPSHLYLGGESMIPTHNTAISGAWGRWAVETWGPYQLVLYAGNDAAQAKERGFAALSKSIEMTPDFDPRPTRRELPGKWRLLDAEARHVNGGIVKAIPVDAIGEAGANPSLTVFTELWGFVHKAALRFWAEMAPSPTRLNSMRWVETYAGFEGESELLWGLYESTVLNGRQLTAGEMALATDTPLGAFEEAQSADDLIPCWVNEQAGIFVLWDAGPAGARMPWQQGERGRQYYANEAATQTPGQFKRIHEDEWVSAESAFVDIAQWDACLNPLPLVPGERTPLVIALDAAVTGDCFGLTVVSRDPDNPKEGIAVRAARKWDPPKGGAIDFREPEAAVRELCGQRWFPDGSDTPAPWSSATEGTWRKVPGAGYNVAEVAYDPYQLHDFATRLQKEGVAWFRPFPQGIDRLKADKALYDLIVSRRIRHDGNPALREHIANANAKQGKQEDSRLRLIKKSENRKIDLAVCLSMSSAECLRLLLL